MSCSSAIKGLFGFLFAKKAQSSSGGITIANTQPSTTYIHLGTSAQQMLPPKDAMPKTSPVIQQKDSDPLQLVCATCRVGPFSYHGFRKACVGTNTSDAGEYIYTTTWRSISDAVTHEGCNWCSLLIRCRDGLPDTNFPRSGPDEEVVVRIQITIQPPLDWMDVTNTLDLYLNEFKAASYLIYAETGNIAAQVIGTGDHFREEPSYVDYSKAKEWLESCSDHENCAAIYETPLPTRVVDCSNPMKPRLFETHRKIKGHYCALSYVWGGDQRQKTTTANIDTHIHEGFDTTLPQTIADAILATHNLGLQYLWVDALCILQDSVEDKVHELADMAHIYQDAYVTLSVVSAFRADQGFLPDEREHVILPFHLEHDVGPSKSVDRMLMKYYIPRPVRSRGYKHQSVVSYEPLHDRGWCFQETILSPRKLTFTPPSVRYECRSFSKNLTRQVEGGDDEPPFKVDAPPLFARPDKNGATGEHDVQDNDPLHEHWGQLIVDYTGRKITVPTDKLVAFASVAEVFQSAMKDNYVAGLWRHKLIDDLLWRPLGAVGPNQVLPPRPKNTVHRHGPGHRPTSRC
ncbi:hypothetical protein GALMADRAFT_574571 [Galerina marginata CBS 339.88]|uniref:Heterokaryon incompatibility domain-containing protein n=1 Tax=Galerina marginata (strain CBS 339.88) TaxID=685588 RepID=A0A067SW33_GALM3|nr:hypothetical protein GALMADRAFT_574571 [Galerina marginata CBS 339.88]